MLHKSSFAETAFGTMFFCRELSRPVLCADWFGAIAMFFVVIVIVVVVIVICTINGGSCCAQCGGMGVEIGRLCSCLCYFVLMLNTCTRVSQISIYEEG